jgi:arylsulfatase A-like enzyme
MRYPSLNPVKSSVRSLLGAALVRVFAALLPIQSFAMAPSAKTSRVRPPNIVVLYADDLGYGDLSCYGAKGLPTPHLDQMAAEGVRFTNFYATAATCTPSRYSLLTGSYPWRNPRAKILAGDAPMIIGPTELTVPAALKRAGYATSVVGKWHIGLGDGKIDWNGDIRPAPIDVGFDESFIMAATNDRVPCVYVQGRRVVNLDPADPLEVHYGKENPFPDVPTGRTHPELLIMPHRDRQHYDTIVNGVPRIGFSRGGKSATWDDTTMTDVFLKQAKAFITKEQGRPFFLYLGLHQPHVPRIPSARFKGASAKGPRGDVILELDWAVGEVVAHLKSLGLADDTIVVFSSDNGPILTDGYLDRAAELNGDHSPAGPLRGGKYSLFDGGTRVPTIIWAPGRAKAGVSDALLSHVDFLASFADLAGVTLSESEKADSLPLAEAILGRTAKARDQLVTEGFGAKTVLRQGNWVYMPAYPGPALFGDKMVESGYASVSQLYDLSSDIGQTKNLSSESPDKVTTMKIDLKIIVERKKSFEQ